VARLPVSEGVNALWNFARPVGNVLGHLWNLPNTLIGLAFGLGGRATWDGENRVVVLLGGWVPAIFRRLGYAGMCVGDVVLCAYAIREHWPPVYRHEIVHAVQGRLLGPLYLPVTLLGYLYGFCLSPREAHDASPLEIWADVASGNAAGNRFLNPPLRREGKRQ
jgi:hypothetical protein